MERRGGYRRDNQFIRIGAVISLKSIKRYRLIETLVSPEAASHPRQV